MFLSNLKNIYKIWHDYHPYFSYQVEMILDYTQKILNLMLIYFQFLI
jgi:hypothetical protein